MRNTALFTLPVLAALVLSGCASLGNRTPATGPIPCTYRFKMLTRAEDQARVEAAINAVAVGPVTKSGTVTFPEYRFRVKRLADLDALHPKLLFAKPATTFTPNRQQTVNLKSAGVDVTSSPARASITNTPAASNPTSPRRWTKTARSPSPPPSRKARSTSTPAP